jgi:predicted metal-dependent hydrolase
LEEPLARLSSQLGVKVKGIRVNNARTLWGSSTSKGTLNFTNRLAMAPQYVVEYLVAHELCHQVHMNHSKDFWKLVGRVCPSYQRAEGWLKDTGRWLEL